MQDEYNTMNTDAGENAAAEAQNATEAPQAQAQPETQNEPPQDAAYRSFYETTQPPQPGNGYYAPQRPEKRGGPWGYIATAVVALIVGMLLGALLFAGEDKGPQAGFSLPELPFGAPESAKPEKPKASPTPLPTSRPAPAVDGQTPTIENSVNPIPDIVEQVSPGVIGVNGYVASKDYERDMAGSLGTGFLFSTEGYVMTCAHIIEGMDRVSVSMPDGTEVDAAVMGADKTMDVAVLKIDAKNLTVLKMGDSDSLRVGDFVIAIGDPTGRELSGTTTFGIVSATARSVNIDGSSNVYIQTDAAVNPGSSGGALLNMQGEVVGLTSAKTVTADYDEYGNAISAEGLGFATPINEAMDIALELIINGYVRHPGLGFSVLTMDERSAAEYEVPEGILVYSVTKDSPADKAGVKPNDILLTCDGVTLSDQDEFVAYIKSRQVGDEIKLTLWRDGDTSTVSIVLGDLNELGDELSGGYADFEFGSKK